VTQRTWLYVGDVNLLDYGGVFLRRLAGGRRRWHAVRLDNMDDACGRDNEGQPTYAVALTEVDLDALTDERRGSVARSIDVQDDAPEAEWAYAAAMYGQHAPLWDGLSNNGGKLLREAKRESRALEGDAGAYAERMERPVNRLGQTAREFQAGDMIPALQRGVAAGDPSVKLIARVYRAVDGNTLGGERVPIELVVETGEGS
jgi:hypothetical protein